MEGKAILEDSDLVDRALIILRRVMKNKTLEMVSSLEFAETLIAEISKDPLATAVALIILSLSLRDQGCEVAADNLKRKAQDVQNAYIAAGVSLLRQHQIEEYDAAIPALVKAAKDPKKKADILMNLEESVKERAEIMEGLEKLKIGDECQMKSDEKLLKMAEVGIKALYFKTLD
jgi:hypothetical protein